MIIEKEINHLGQKVLRLLNKPNCALDIFLLPNGEIKKLKPQFIKKKTEPNVLAFPEPREFPHPETKKKYLGEIYLNRDILRKTPARAAPLLLHGILHLLGHNHTKKTDTMKMERLERKILTKI